MDKSSFLLYSPLSAGSVLIDGIDVRELDAGTLRQFVGLVRSLNRKRYRYIF